MLPERHGLGVSVFSISNQITKKLQANILEDDLPHDEIAVANIDVDMFETILAALTKVAPRMVLGGVILLEDAT